jgi:hypothetical protein
MLSWNMSINNCAVTILFDWYGEEPDWEDMEVIALLPTPEPNKAKYWVTINDLLSNKDWDDIRGELYWNEDQIMKQKADNEY